MVDSDGSVKPHCYEDVGTKKKIVKKKKEKILPSTSTSGSNRVTLVNCSENIEVKPNDMDNKVKQNRRRTRHKKSVVPAIVSNECSSKACYINPGALSNGIANVTIDFKNRMQSSSVKQTYINNVMEIEQRMQIITSVKNHVAKYDVMNSKLSSNKKEFTKSKTNYARQKNDSDHKISMDVGKDFGNDRRKRKSMGQQKSEKNKFESYMSIEEVEYGLQTGLLFSSYLRINPKDFKLSYVSNPNKKEQDILIESLRDRNGALEGDLVVIKLKDETEWRSSTQKTGTVVYIKEKVHPRTAIGHLKLMADKNKEFAIFHPRDSRVPRIKIPFTDWPPLFYDQSATYEDVMFLVKITEWTDTRYAVGTILDNVGMSGDIKTETKAILMENCLKTTPYSEEMKQYFPKTGDIPVKEFEYRVDLRKECVFTIDPASARDLDDAVSCKQLADGTVEVGVHISDVTHYLQEGTPLDAEVCERATTVYMVESVYHMLPKEMCMLCSLLPGQDKLAFSVFWQMSPEGKVLSHRFSRTVLNSCVQLSYEHAQLMIDDPDRTFAPGELPEIHNGFTAQDLSRIVNQLHKIAVRLRESRFESGALRIDQPKLMFSLDPSTCLPVSYNVYENKPCHQLIEEFMLLANITVATRVHADFPQMALLRSHPEPHAHMLQQLQLTLEKVGIHLDVTSAGALQRTLWRYAGPDSAHTMLVLSALCAKPMTRAHYFCAGALHATEPDAFWHYALNVPLYTHFTSPIRRYADVTVHRLLAASLGYVPPPAWSEPLVSQIAANCNKQKYNAKRAGEQSLDMYLVHYVALRQPLTERAVVMDVKDNSFDVIVIAYGATVRLYLNNLDQGVKHQLMKCQNDSEEERGKKLNNIEIFWPATNGLPITRQVISIFSIVTVLLSKKEKALKLEAKLIRPDPLL